MDAERPVELALRAKIGPQGQPYSRHCTFALAATSTRNVSITGHMAQEYKGRPPRLERVFTAFPLYFITFNTLLRRRLLACEPVHEAFRKYALRGIEFHAAIGRYVLMPDHVHLFVRISHGMTLTRWETDLKQAMGKALSAMGYQPTQMPAHKLCSYWQPGFDDHLLRSDESYAEKWNYVWHNPVRAGLVTRPEDWPYQGKIFEIDRL